MTKMHQIYKCTACGNVIQILHTGVPSLICCGNEMALMEPQTADSTLEKHVPVVEKTATGIKVTVGSTIHPMEPLHYIEWIEVITKDRKYLKFLQPGAAPEATFDVTESPISVREYCNIHGLWQTEA